MRDLEPHGLLSSPMLSPKRKPHFHLPYHLLLREATRKRAQGGGMGTNQAMKEKKEVKLVLPRKAEMR